MKLFAIKAYGNYGGGWALVRAETEERAREIAAKISDRNWQTRYDKPDEVEELTFTGEGVLYRFETGE